jgi:Ribosomal RNA large subunit methyltransferase D, RlmJ
MANRHFAKLADVWKHLPLAEVLAIDRPRHYWESHAGSAVYGMADDPERQFGALRLGAVAADQPDLAACRYLAGLRALNDGPDGPLTRYPGSAWLAMHELGRGADYLLCDTDPASADDLRAAAASLGVADRVEVLAADGRDALAAALDAASDPGAVLAHVDPYDPRSPGTAGLSALDLARRLIDAGAGLVYWYGYDAPGGRGWALDELADGTAGRPLWGGDVLVTSAAPPGVDDGGDLGDATTPGTGFGVVCANVSPAATDACRRLGEALVAAWDGAPLPDGRPGRLELACRTVT